MNRPRCSRYIPLCTNQMRLRSLIRIYGVNIKLLNDSSDSSNLNSLAVNNGGKESTENFKASLLEKEPVVFYTLHHSKDEAAFYTSESLPMRHHHQKWAEILCPEVMKSNAISVVVKVWFRCATTTSSSSRLSQAQVSESGETTDTQEANGKCEMVNTESSSQQTNTKISALTRELNNSILKSRTKGRPPDTRLLFTWGVNFSGLILVSLQQAEAKFRANSLIFQLNSEYFASPDNCTVDSLREQLSENYQRYSSSLPVGYPIPNHKPLEGVDTVERGFAINSPHVSRSSSPVPKAAPPDAQQDLMSMSRTRYAELYCRHIEVRRSYNLDCLLNIQELQRLNLQKKRETLELAEDIKQLSVHCVTNEQTRRKRRTISSSLSTSSSHMPHHSMGRKLSILLAENEVVDPQTLLRVQSLRKDLETLRSRRSLLQNEHKSYSRRIATLRLRLRTLATERQEREAKLESQRTEELFHTQRLQALYQDELRLLQDKRDIQHQVDKRVATLCLELREIYPIYRNQKGFHEICGVPFPNIDMYVNGPKSGSGQIHLEQVISPLTLSASFGYFARLVHMISVITDLPLRNPIVHDPTGTRILDKVKDIPYGAREFPLYTRSSIPSKALKYATFLFNQNVAQLCYDITGLRCDLRATVENVMHIFSIFSEIVNANVGCVNKLSEVKTRRSHTHPSNRLLLLPTTLSNQSLATCASSANGSVSNFQGTSHRNPIEEIDGELSQSHSSVDIQNAPQPPLVKKLPSIYLRPNVAATQPKPIVERNVALGVDSTEQRVSRSVGSYSDSDDDFKDINNHCYSNSDSNIAFRGQPR